LSNCISADGFGMAFDNDYSDNPKDWKTYIDVQKAKSISKYSFLCNL